MRNLNFLSYLILSTFLMTSCYKGLDKNCKEFPVLIVDIDRAIYSFGDTVRIKAYLSDTIYFSSDADGKSYRVFPIYKVDGFIVSDRTKQLEYQFVLDSSVTNGSNASLSVSIIFPHPSGGDVTFTKKMHFQVTP